MAEEITVQILTQASENIQKLFELSTRIDERVKAIQAKQDGVEARIEQIALTHHLANQKIAVLESSGNKHDIEECERHIADLEKRLVTVEMTSGQTQDRWNRVISFIIQLIWVILAAWFLTKLHLQAPAVP
jgi:chromosome segregation ATPase